MTDDIVTRLRNNLFHIQEGCGEFACEYLDTDLSDKDLLDAADEIEHLRAEVEHLTGNAKELFKWVIELKEKLEHFDESED